MIDWSAIDKLDKDSMMKQVWSQIEAPADFQTNVIHFGHGFLAFALVAGGLYFLQFFAEWLLLMKSAR
jgi:hypothetical protein